jgi:hypothetical protein
MAAALSLVPSSLGCPAPGGRPGPCSIPAKSSLCRLESGSLRCQPPAVSGGRTLPQHLAARSASRPSRLAAATFQAPSVSFLPPSPSKADQADGARAAAPKQHTGPPVFVKATGRIVASELPRGQLVLRHDVLHTGPSGIHMHPISRTPTNTIQHLIAILALWLQPCCHLTQPRAPASLSTVGDIHGDLQKALACLEMAGVLAEDDGHIKWVGGDAVVVQLGDVLDRGDCEIGGCPVRCATPPPVPCALFAVACLAPARD